MRLAEEVLVAALLSNLPLAAAAPGVAALQSAGTGAPLPSCEWCGAAEAPEDLRWEVRIAGEDEPGEPLVVEGTVYEPDGMTPAPGVILYLYHTNARGVYPKRGDETGNARRHGYLRGWLRTDERGRYRFTTIRPGSYPGRDAPAHIHVTVKEPDRAEYWIDSFLFDGDPRLTPKIRQQRGSGIIALRRGPDGRWRGERDIVLDDRP